ncbi:MAG TPA: ferredoxin family protein [Abditibacteriaceae bacterium]|nr:ferredoxin family protein [Abditibacteriaceae bacterium]
MTYVIAEPCIGVKDKACVEVCPVDCIHELPDGSSPQLYINPAECIDCGACEPECPVEAIFEEAAVPAEWKHYTQLNADFFDQ